MAANSRELLNCSDQPPKPSLLESLLLGPQDIGKRGGDDGKAKAGPLTTPVPPSQVLGKIKDFLGVMAKANEKLELEAQENSRVNYDIEVLSGNEQEYIEMDLLLGVTDLHTARAVAAAEAAMSSFQPSMTSTGRISSDTEDDCDEGDDEDNVDNTTYAMDKHEKSDSVNNVTSCNNKPSKRPKIVVLD